MKSPIEAAPIGYNCPANTRRLNSGDQAIAARMDVVTEKLRKLPRWARWTLSWLALSLVISAGILHFNVLEPIPSWTIDAKSEFVGYDLRGRLLIGIGSNSVLSYARKYDSNYAAFDTWDFKTRQRVQSCTPKSAPAFFDCSYPFNSQRIVWFRDSKTPGLDVMLSDLETADEWCIRSSCYYRNVCLCNHEKTLLATTSTGEKTSTLELIEFTIGDPPHHRQIRELVNIVEYDLSRSSELLTVSDTADRTSVVSTATGKVLWTGEKTRAALTAVNDTVVAALHRESNKVDVFSLSEGKLLRTFELPQGEELTLHAFSSDASQLAVTHFAKEGERGIAALSVLDVGTGDVQRRDLRKSEHKYWLGRWERPGLNGEYLGEESKDSWGNWSFALYGIFDRSKWGPFPGRCELLHFGPETTTLFSGTSENRKRLLPNDSFILKLFPSLEKHVNERFECRLTLTDVRSGSNLGTISQQLLCFALPDKFITVDLFGAEQRKVSVWEYPLRPSLSKVALLSAGASSVAFAVLGLCLKIANGIRKRSTRRSAVASP